jgi:hypothetical protein
MIWFGKESIMNVLMKMLAKVLVTVVTLASPELVKELKDFAVKYRTKCAATENPWDDILAEALCGLLGV